MVVSCRAVPSEVPCFDAVLTFYLRFYCKGPHIGLVNAWPMSLLVQAQTSDDDDEIKECIGLVLDSAKLGLVHESVNVNYAASYTSTSWTVGSPKFPVPFHTPISRSIFRPNILRQGVGLHGQTGCLRKQS